MDPMVETAGEGFLVRVDAGGGMEVQTGSEGYRIESTFSFPGERIGFNALGGTTPSGEMSWRPAVRRLPDGAVCIEAAGRFYALERTLRIEKDRIAVTDRLRGLSHDDVGVIVAHRVRCDAGCEEILIAGAPAARVDECPTNPTIFFSGPESRLGVVAEDTLSRLQFAAAVSDGEGGFSLLRLAVRPGAQRVLRWALYPLGTDRGYFDFINRVRRDWKTNFTVKGPFDFAPSMKVWQDPDRLRAYLERKKLALAAPGHWLDYDNYDATAGRFETREEYRERMRAVYTALKAVDPSIQVLANMEGPLVSVPVNVSKRLWEALPEDQRGQYYPKVFTEEQLRLIGQLPVLQQDSLLQGPAGETYYELYYRGRGEDRTPLVALLVYPAPGNQQMAFWMDQARFVMEDVGLDGIYLDGGGPVREGRYGYDRWDGVTVNIDPETGRISRRYTDHMLVIGDVPCRTLFDYVLGRGGTMVCNGHHYTEQMQSYPIPRFLETGGLYDPLALGRGEKPPLIPAMHLYGHLDAPVALAQHPGNHGEHALRNYAKFVMKCVITHLRHGLLYYYYGTEIPETGPGSGEYGPINHMFPITPVELHEGWILGREKIVTARSLDLVWEKDGRPEVHLFDIRGRQIPAGDHVTVGGEGGRWSLRLNIEDWEQIAVVE